MVPEPDRYRQIAEECRAFAEEAKSRNWTEMYVFLNERALLNDQMAEAMSRSVVRLRGRRPEERAW
ncbi:MAG: hypothetical protein JO139_07615 [Alphaproteobacteria bacterium]|nr:hypothetical protein [Alphaproteobacteria bacterium]